MLARDASRLNGYSDELEGAGAFVCDVSDPVALIDTFNQIVKRLGSPSVVIHNAVGGVFGDFMSIEPEALEKNFRINTMALLHLARLSTPAMIEAGSGAIIATGNTSAYRGIANFSGFAPTKAAQRILLESIARSVGPKGIHAAYIAIDAVIDVAWTRERYPDKPDDFFCKPDDIVGEVFHVAHQPRSTWSSEYTIRPFAEKW